MNVEPLFGNPAGDCFPLLQRSPNLGFIHTLILFFNVINFNVVYHSELSPVWFARSRSSTSFNHCVQGSLYHSRSSFSFHGVTSFALMLSQLNLSQVSAQGFKESIWDSLNKLNSANLFQIWCCTDSEGILYFQCHPAGPAVKYSLLSMIVWVFPSSQRSPLSSSANSLDFWLKASETKTERISVQTKKKR